MSLKNIIYVKKDYIWNPSTCSGENGKCLASIMDDSVITCDEIIEETKTVPTNFNEKKQPVKHRIFILHFLLISIALLIAVSTCCYLIKYKIKQKHLLPFHGTNNELKEIIY